MSGGDGMIRARYAGALGDFKLDVAFEVPLRGITALWGPSGCGKTSILRCIAGLNRLPGRLSVDGEVWQDDGVFRRPYERPVGYVFQEASLFAHLSVRGNLLYGHRRALRRGAAETFRLDDAVELLGLGHLLARAPAALSGGERQRVALGRALLAQPRLLLMDEPLSALDRMTRDELLPYFETLDTALGIPILYVTHDIAEIERLAVQMVILQAGRVVASGPLNALATDTRLPVARAPEAATVLDAEIAGYDAQDRLTALRVDGETFLVPRRCGAPGGRHRIRIAATDVSLARARAHETTILNIVPVRVRALSPLDDAQLNVVVGIGHRDDGSPLLVRITRRAQRLLDLAPGQDVYAQIKGVSLVATTGAPAAPATGVGEPQAAAGPSFDAGRRAGVSLP